MKSFIAALAILVAGCASNRASRDNLPSTRVIGTADIKSLPGEISAAQLMRRWGRPLGVSREAVMVYPTAIDGVTVNVALRTPESLPIDLDSAEVTTIFIWTDEATIENARWTNTKTK